MTPGVQGSVTGAGLWSLLWPALVMAVGCATIGICLLVARGGRQELRARETWALAVLLAIAGFALTLTDPFSLALRQLTAWMW